MRVVRRSLLLVAVVAAFVGVVPARAAVPTTWSDPVDLDAPNEVAGQARVAIDAAGNSLAVWLASTGTPQEVLRSATRPVGGQWSAPVDRAGPVEIDRAPVIAENATGDAVVAWSAWNGAHFTAHVATVTSDGAWTNPIELSPPDESVSDLAAVVAGDAHAVVAWDGAGGVESATFTFGGGWSSIDTVTSEGAFNVTIAANEEGDVDAVWGRPATQDLQAAHRPVGGSWTTPVGISTPGSVATSASVATGPVTTVAMWTSTTGTDAQVEWSERAQDGSWSSPEMLTDLPDESAGAIVSTASDGASVAVVFQNQPGFGFISRSSTRATGSDWSALVDVTDGPVPIDSIALTMSGVGDVALVETLRQPDDTFTAVLQTLPRGGSWSAPLDLSRSSSYARDAAVALNDAGEAVVAWTNNPGTTSSANAQVTNSPAPIAPPLVEPPIVLVPRFTG